jgi:hypothetical protein
MQRRAVMMRHMASETDRRRGSGRKRRRDIQQGLQMFSALWQSDPTRHIGLQCGPCQCLTRWYLSCDLNGRTRQHVGGNIKARMYAGAIGSPLFRREMAVFREVGFDHPLGQ